LDPEARSLCFNYSIFWRFLPQVGFAMFPN
jgi:hypothetical protein